MKIIPFAIIALMWLVLFALLPDTMHQANFAPCVFGAAITAILSVTVLLNREDITEWLRKRLI